MRDQAPASQFDEADLASIPHRVEGLTGHSAQQLTRLSECVGGSGWNGSGHVPTRVARLSFGVKHGPWLSCLSMNDQTNDHPTIEQIVGERIRHKRELLGLTQKELGERLGQYLDKPWNLQAVYEAEKGLRAFRVAELVGFAAALDMSIGRLTDPGGETVRLPSGMDVEPDDWPGRSVEALREWRAETLMDVITTVEDDLDMVHQAVTLANNAAAESLRFVKSLTGQGSAHLEIRATATGEFISSKKGEESEKK